MRARFTVCFLALLAIAGCSGPASPRMEAPSPTAGRSTDALEAIYWARIDSARTRFTEADVRYMTGMIGHHAQAIVMSAWAPTNGASPQVQTLAARIDNAQRDEIRSMQRWLRDRDQPVPEVDAMGRTTMPGGAMDHSAHAMPGHDMSGMDGHAMMPGMLTDAQLRELDAARGLDFDRLYLTYMIQHHGGAVVMVNELFASDGAAQDEQAFKLASDVQVDQRTEIARMQRMLDALPPAE